MARLAVSNIAWTNDEEPAIALMLQELGVAAIEIAPTKRWSDPTKASREEIDEYRGWWSQFGIEVVAFQSMLFSRPDLKLFESVDLRNELAHYMEEFLHLAGDMGAKKLVFGSPKNRQRGRLNPREADVIARDFFSSLGRIAEKYGTILCIEPNAPQYSCDYITTANEGATLVRSVDADGFGLHLDTACMTLAGDDMVTAINDNIGILKHFHVSAPMLDRVYDRDDVDYRAAAQALHDTKYDGMVSIEMRPSESGANAVRVEEAVRFVKSIFTID